MKKTDTRVRYTKSVLQKALLEILEKKNIERISVKELCEKAAVNRGTFYLHYGTPNDVLYEIENQFFEENLKLYSTYMENDYPIDQLSLVFAGILKNAGLCRIIMGPNGNPKFQSRVRDMMRPGVIQTWQKEFPDYSKAHLEYVYDYIFAGSMTLILNWINQEQPDIPAEELANRLDRLGHYCHLAIREFSQTA